MTTPTEPRTRRPRNSEPWRSNWPLINLIAILAAALVMCVGVAGMLYGLYLTGQHPERPVDTGNFFNLTSSGLMATFALIRAPSTTQPTQAAANPPAPQE